MAIPSTATPVAEAAPPRAQVRPPSRIATVIRVTSGNFIEMYDFFLFGFYATYIALSLIHI